MSKRTVLRSDHSPFSKSTVTCCTAVLAPETEQIYLSLAKPEKGFLTTANLRQMWHLLALPISANEWQI